jgi:hypothetical protein
MREPLKLLAVSQGLERLTSTSSHITIAACLLSCDNRCASREGLLPRQPALTGNGGKTMRPLGAANAKSRSAATTAREPSFHCRRFIATGLLGSKIIAANGTSSADRIALRL